jgi:hypothetical protein
VTVYDQSERLVKKLSVSENGDFSTSLPEGVYTIRVNLKGIEKTTSLPRKIEILPGETATVRLDIDTGLR